MHRGKTRLNKGSRETIGKVDNGILIVRESYVYEGMFMYGSVCFFGRWWGCMKPRENGGGDGVE